MRKVFYYTAAFTIILMLGIHLFWTPITGLFFIVLPIIALGIYDTHSHHNVLRNYPVTGHLRYLFEFIRPEIQQYFIATNLSGRPFNRQTRDLVYERAKGVADTLPFGTQHNISDSGFEYAFHSLMPEEVAEHHSRIIIGNEQCLQPYSASRLNVSGMSFGALSPTAVKALNLGASLGHFAHNTGEGGISIYHLSGGDLIWQIGTGYFGCRDENGLFDSAKFTQKSHSPAVKMIEIKLSQGAKPSHGGILPGAKVNTEIALARDVIKGKDCISPPRHSSFDSPLGLLAFVKQCRELSGGKPVGFKLCIGKRSEFMGICKAMQSTGIIPDFITVDGAEGGTGAAPMEFSNYIGMPLNDALVLVHSCLLGVGLRQHIKIIASGKVATGFDMVTKIALGADACNSARAMLFAVGCIQALRCHTNTCPTGVTTQNKDRYSALVPEEKQYRVQRYHQATIKSFLDLVGAMGLCSPDDLTPKHIMRRTDDNYGKPYSEIYVYLNDRDLLKEIIDPEYALDWELARADAFV